MPFCITEAAASAATLLPMRIMVLLMLFFCAHMLVCRACLPDLPVVHVYLLVALACIARPLCLLAADPRAPAWGACMPAVTYLSC